MLPAADIDARASGRVFGKPSIFSPLLFRFICRFLAADSEHDRSLGRVISESAHAQAGARHSSAAWAVTAAVFFLPSAPRTRIPAGRSIRLIRLCRGSA